MRDDAAHARPASRPRPPPRRPPRLQRSRAADRAGRWASAAATTAPTTSPPRCARQSMIGMAKVMTRLITSRVEDRAGLAAEPAHDDVVGAEQPEDRTGRADAELVGLGEQVGQRRAAERRQRRRARGSEPGRARSRAPGPRLASANMFIARWKTPRVQERRREQPVVLAVGDAHGSAADGTAGRLAKRDCRSALAGRPCPARRRRRSAPMSAMLTRLVSPLTLPPKAVARLRAPTGCACRDVSRGTGSRPTPSCMQSGQIGRSHRVQRT